MVEAIVPVYINWRPVRIFTFFSIIASQLKFLERRNCLIFQCFTKLLGNNSESPGVSVQVTVIRSTNLDNAPLFPCIRCGGAVIAAATEDHALMMQRSNIGIAPVSAGTAKVSGAAMPSASVARTPATTTKSKTTG